MNQHTKFNPNELNGLDFCEMNYYRVFQNKYVDADLSILIKSSITGCPVDYIDYFNTANPVIITE